MTNEKWLAIQSGYDMAAGERPKGVRIIECRSDIHRDMMRHSAQPAGDYAKRYDLSIPEVNQIIKSEIDSLDDTLRMARTTWTGPNAI